MTKVSSLALLPALALLASALLPAQQSRIEGCREDWEHGRKAAARQCYLAIERTAADPALQAEAYWKLGDRKTANERFRAAAAARPKDAGVLVAWGRLFLETYNKAEAAKLFKEALAIDPRSAAAHLGLAQVAADNFEGSAVKEASEALKLQPDLTEAHTLLASMALEEGDAKKAAEHLDKALATKGSPLEAYALEASIDLLAGRSASEWVNKALAYNPAYGDVYATPAHFFVITRRYQEAVDLYRKAVTVDPELWDAQAQLGVNLWRLGDEAEARQHLEIAYRGDPYSPTTVNSLRLMDSLKNFKSFSTPRVTILLHQKEAELLRPYVEELLLKALDTYQEKYQYKLQKPVRLELYPDHEDFAVRTMGMPGLGALGVTFGYVVAMDSPSGRPPGEFHWGDTLWHELCHVFVLEKTGHKAPRWLSEGLSVYEEMHAPEGWGDRLTPDVITAIKDKKLLPVTELDRGFIRPTYPSQVVVSYYQAGQVCDLVASKWGFAKLLDMLQAYVDGLTTPQVIEKALGVSAEEFDRQFADFIRGRTEKVVTSFDPEWRRQMEAMIRLAKERKFAEVIEPARRVRDLYPQYTGAGNAYEILAEALLETGDKAGAAAELDRYRKAGGHSLKALKQLAALQEELGRRGDAIGTLAGINWIFPGDEEQHARLGNLLLADGKPKQAVREFEAEAALKPLDVAAVEFNLARAYYQLQDREKTRAHLLEALEAAPDYRPAQKLLLEINR